ncbi:Lipoprotein-releasing system ATP-binding protein LolD [Dissostichus eleginoides]|uniref:Lipoprotein-releasing system ATP-binding protein LolD n=1 Tax=Dissostichus eleginoides TaxID=100907 RepID=A0AAD9B992_DISEL|nr:Lipoprotein-releasing system ATP-binding protein LolD [Dissostichus eleginoides]
MPMDLNLERLDDGNGIEYTLKAHRAEWHKKCRLKFNEKAFNEQSPRELTTGQHQSTYTVHTRSAHSHPQSTEPTCFICNEPAGSADLHNSSTYNIHTNVRKCALELEDTVLLAKLAAEDMIAIEDKYHHHCLRSLYNRARQAAPKGNERDDSFLHGRAFAELVAYLEDMKSDEDSAPVFKLIDIAQLYKIRLEQLGLTVEKQIHTTRLKNRLLSALPHLRAHSQGRDTLLSFEKDIGPALMMACHHDSDSMYLMRAAQVVRKEIFESGFSFDGSFKANCQQEAVPPSLLALVNMILDGANIKHQTQLVHTATTKPALTISRLMVFNSVKHAGNVDSPSSARHSRSQETPLPL